MSGDYHENILIIIKTSVLITLIFFINLGINFYSIAMQECPILKGLALLKVVEYVSEGKIAKKEVLKVLPEELRRSFDMMLSVTNDIKRLDELGKIAEKNIKTAERDITLTNFYKQLPGKVSEYINSIFCYFLKQPTMTEDGLIIKAIEDNNLNMLEILYKELKKDPNNLLEYQMPLHVLLLQFLKLSL